MAIVDPKENGFDLFILLNDIIIKGRNEKWKYGRFPSYNLPMALFTLFKVNINSLFFLFLACDILFTFYRKLI